MEIKIKIKDLLQMKLVYYNKMYKNFFSPTRQIIL